jgi:two-component system, NtrC family, nitrogen regulation sensor histidine kinase NtrY
MAAGVAHELRNPLAVILARVQLLQLGIKNGKSPDVERLTRTLATIEEQALRASKIIENLSTFARPRTPELASVDLADTVNLVIRGMGGHPPAGPLATEIDIGDGAATIVADRNQLIAALVQLIRNALDAMPDGGRLRVHAHGGKDTVEISVADSGAGVAPHDAPRIFEPFFSTRPGAAGLGLCVAQTVAHSHGGAVRLVTVGGPGAEFILSLPART